MKDNIKNSFKITIPKTKEEAFSIGYIDGYFTEEAYFSYINGKYIESYSTGYAYGAEKQKNVKLEKFQMEKEIWLTKLAIYDASILNFTRKISEDSKDIYNMHFNDMIKALGSEVTNDFFEKQVKEGLAIEDQNSPWGYSFIEKNEKTKKGK